MKRRNGALAAFCCMVCFVLVACSEQESPKASEAPSSSPPPRTAPADVSASQRFGVSAFHFTNITRESGIDFITTSGSSPSTQILEVNGSGLGLIDFDNDGDLDVFIANGATMDDPERGPGSRLFRNDGDMRFTDITQAAQIDLRRWAMGVAVGDVDGDGFDDLFIACYGPDVLLRNNGDGTFSDVSQPAGVANENRWGTSAAFGDIDNDGDLDLYVVNYLEFDARNPPPRAKYKGVEVMAGPHGLRPQHDFLYQNQGDGTFRDITAEAGTLAPHAAYGLNAVILDFDNDGWRDICVANDSMPDFLFRNKGIEAQPLDALMPSFEEIGVISGIASNIDGGNQASMGIAVADVDDNGFADKFITVFSSDTNTLHLNIDGRLFEDRSTSYGLGMISRPYLGWACGFYDFDLDGDEDLLMFNGHVYPEATMQSMDSDYEQTPLLFARDGKKFRRVQGPRGLLAPGSGPAVNSQQPTADSPASGPWLSERHRDRSAVFGDLDGDGDVDVIVCELNGPVRVLRNEARGLLALGSRPAVNGQQPTGDSPASGELTSDLRPLTSERSWLTVALHDSRPTSKNHRGIGARVQLLQGDRVIQRRWIFSGGGFQSSSEMAAHFGLGEAAGVDTTDLRLRVIWPDGVEQIVEHPQPNQRLVVERRQ